MHQRLAGDRRRPDRAAVERLVPGEFALGIDDHEQDWTLSGCQLCRHMLSFS